MRPRNPLGHGVCEGLGESEQWRSEPSLWGSGCLGARVSTASPTAYNRCRQAVATVRKLLEKSWGKGIGGVLSGLLP